jgi:hypothetical protein
MSKKNETIQLTSFPDYDTKRMIFSEPVSVQVPNSTITYKRININTLYPDGSIGPLIVSTPRIFSFGVSENKDFNNPEKINGHTLPLCLWNREGPSDEEKMWTDTFDRVVEQCKKHLLRNKEEIGQYELTIGDLKKLSPLYWKREKGKIVEKLGPTLYPKLIAAKKQNKIFSLFYDQYNSPIEPLSLLGKYCFATAAVKIESIYIGSKFSVQTKLYEATVKLAENTIRPLLPRFTVEPTLKEEKEELLSDVGSIEDDEDAEVADVVEVTEVTEHSTVLVEKPKEKRKRKVKLVRK